MEYLGLPEYKISGKTYDLSSSSTRSGLYQAPNPSQGPHLDMRTTTLSQICGVVAKILPFLIKSGICCLQFGKGCVV